MLLHIKYVLLQCVCTCNLSQIRAKELACDTTCMPTAYRNRKNPYISQGIFIAQQSPLTTLPAHILRWDFTHMLFWHSRPVASEVNHRPPIHQSIPKVVTYCKKQRQKFQEYAWNHIYEGSGCSFNTLQRHTCKTWTNVRIQKCHSVLLPFLPTALVIQSPACKFAGFDVLTTICCMSLHVRDGLQ